MYKAILDDMEEALGEDVLAETLVYLDEVGFADQDTNPIRGYSKIGKRLYGEVFGSKRKRVNLIGALCNKKILPCLLAFRGPTNKETFNYWFKRMLIPQLRLGQIVIMDNAKFHGLYKEVIDLLNSKQCYILYLPKYSPDLNPIEKIWAMNIVLSRTLLILSKIILLTKTD